MRNKDGYLIDKDGKIMDDEFNLIDENGRIYKDKNWNNKKSKPYKFG